MSTLPLGISNVLPSHALNLALRACMQIVAATGNVRHLRETDRRPLGIWREGIRRARRKRRLRSGPTGSPQAR